MGTAEGLMGANRLTHWLRPVGRKRVFTVKVGGGRSMRRAGEAQGKRVRQRYWRKGTGHGAGEPGSSPGLAASWLCDLGQSTALL